MTHTQCMIHLVFKWYLLKVPFVVCHISYVWYVCHISYVCMLGQISWFFLSRHHFWAERNYIFKRRSISSLKYFTFIHATGGCRSIFQNVNPTFDKIYSYCLKNILIFSIYFISDIAIVGEERGFVGFETGRIWEEFRKISFWRDFACITRFQPDDKIKSSSWISIWKSWIGTRCNRN